MLYLYLYFISLVSPLLSFSFSFSNIKNKRMQSRPSKPSKQKLFKMRFPHYFTSATRPRMRRLKMRLCARVVTVTIFLFAYVSLESTKTLRTEDSFGFQKIRLSIPKKLRNIFSIIFHSQRKTHVQMTFQARWQHCARAAFR